MFFWKKTFQFIYKNLMQDIHSKNKDAFEKDKNQFVQLLLLQDKWLGTNSFFRVGRWLQKARDLMPDSNDKRLCEWNARVQISFWGPDDPKGFLHEYANKEWEGLLKDLYLPQWKKFFEYAEAEINGRKINYPNFFSMERTWCQQQNHYGELPAGNSEAMLHELKTNLVERR